MANVSKTKTVKNPNSSSNKGFVIGVVVVLLAFIAAIFAYTKFAPTKLDTAIGKYENEATNMSLTYDEGVVTLENDPNENAKTINIYEDFSCHYCAALAQSSDADLKNAVESGDMILKIHTMNFLDRGEVGYSTKAFAVAQAMAEDGNVEQYWNFRNFLFSDFETTYGLLGSDEEFENSLVNDLGFEQKYIDMIRNDDQIEAANEDAGKNIASLEELAGDVSSPRVFWDTEEINVQTPNWVDMILSAPGSTMAESQGMTQEELEDSKTDGDNGK